MPDSFARRFSVLASGAVTLLDLMVIQQEQGLELLKLEMVGDESDLTASNGRRELSATRTSKRSATSWRSARSPSYAIEPDGRETLPGRERVGAAVVVTERIADVVDEIVALAESGDEAV